MKINAKDKDGKVISGVKIDDIIEAVVEREVAGVKKKYRMKSKYLHSDIVKNDAGEVVGYMHYHKHSSEKELV